MICGAPARYGGLSAWRKYANVDPGPMWVCNRRVKREGDRCWQHPRTPAEREAMMAGIAERGSAASD
jgi:hypothetical protein